MKKAQRKTKKTHRKFLGVLITLVMVLTFSVGALPAFAGSFIHPPVGQFGILPKDTLTLPGNTYRASLTANWGVRVTFEDADGQVLKSEAVHVTDTTPGETSVPDDPSFDGQVFSNWERSDDSEGTATINDDGTVTDIKGPGPITFVANYERPYTLGGLPPGNDDPTPDNTDPTDPTSDPDNPSSEPDNPNAQDNNDSNVKQTGDSMNITLYVILLAIAATAILGSIVIGKKRKTE